MAGDLSQAFPAVTGFRLRNLRYMCALAEAYPDPEFVQQAVAQLPWGHNVRILDAVKNPAEREWYIRQAVQNGWSRNVLVHQIESSLHTRQGRALTNFSQTLPVPQPELAHQLLKDFILELGKGFAFVGSQHHLDVGGRDFISICSFTMCGCAATS